MTRRARRGIIQSGNRRRTGRRTEERSAHRVTAKVKVVNPQGLHMRPAHVFVGGVKNFSSDVKIVFKGASVNAKSIMHLMAACIKQGSEIEIQCCGEQEADALKAAVELVESGLGE